MSELAILPDGAVFQEYGVPFTDTLAIASVFEKNHGHVLRDVDEIIANLIAIEAEFIHLHNPKLDCETKFHGPNLWSEGSSAPGLHSTILGSEAARNRAVRSSILRSEETGSPVFIEKTYLNARKQSQRKVDLNRPAYSLLVGGYTGLKAFRFKDAFNRRFYQMEIYIKRRDGGQLQGIKTYLFERHQRWEEFLRYFHFGYPIKWIAETMHIHPSTARQYAQRLRKACLITEQDWDNYLALQRARKDIERERKAKVRAMTGRSA